MSGEPPPKKRKVEPSFVLLEDEDGTLFTVNYNRLVFGSKDDKSVKRGQLIKYLDEKKQVKKGLFVQKVRDDDDDVNDSQNSQASGATTITSFSSGNEEPIVQSKNVDIALQPKIVQSENVDIALQNQITPGSSNDDDDDIPQPEQSNLIEPTGGSQTNLGTGEVQNEAVETAEEGATETQDLQSFVEELRQEYDEADGGNQASQGPTPENVDATAKRNTLAALRRYDETAGEGPSTSNNDPPAAVSHVAVNASDPVNASAVVNNVVRHAVARNRQSLPPPQRNEPERNEVSEEEEENDGDPVVDLVAPFVRRTASQEEMENQLLYSHEVVRNEMEFVDLKYGVKVVKNVKNMVDKSPISAEHMASELLSAVFTEPALQKYTVEGTS